MDMDTGRRDSDIFLSYASVDRSTALHLADLLESRGISVWIDRKSIVGGARWSAEIVEGIKSSAVLVVLITPASMQSRNVHQEIQLAWEHQRKILPVLLESAALPPAVEYALVGNQWVEVLDHPESDWLPKVLAALGRLGIAPRGTGERFDAAPPTMAVRLPTDTAGRESATPPTNLPAQTTPLVGRDGEVKRVASWLADPAVRLVTLTGPPGVGKTRLAIAVGSDLRDDFSDGVWFVSLASLAVPALVPSAIASAIGVRERGHLAMLDRLRDDLRLKSLLLVVDNWEHLLEAAPLLSDLLASCPDLKVLATSRSALRLSGEHEFPLDPLSLPDGERLPARDALIDYGSVRLFVERAQAIRPNFDLTDENAADVVAICRRLDGLPLAIELAAARIRLLAPAAILARLQASDGAGPLRLLTGGSKDHLPRQSTLRATILWSYNLLDPSEQALFRRLSVFVGGFDLDATATISAADPELAFDPLDGVASLVAKSLVREEEVAGEARFSMLVTLRDFASEALRERGEWDPTAQAHAAYFLAVVEGAATQLVGPRQRAWVGRLERDHDNLRVAFTELVARDAVQPALRFAAALWHFWRIHGHIAEGRSMCATILAATPEAIRTVARDRVLTSAGNLARMQGDYSVAERDLTAGLALARELNDDVGAAFALLGLGTIRNIRGGRAESRALWEESLALYRRAGDRPGMAMALNNLGATWFGEGAYPRARAHFEESLRISRDSGNLEITALTLTNLGEVAAIQGDDDRALELHVEGLRVAWSFGNRLSAVVPIEHLVGLYASRGEAERATRLDGAVMAFRRLVGNPPSESNRRKAEQTMARCRAVLGDAAFDRAWSEGEGLTLGQAVALALGESSEG